MLTNSVVYSFICSSLQVLNIDDESELQIMELREAVDEAAETQALHQIQAQVWIGFAIIRKEHNKSVFNVYNI